MKKFLVITACIFSLGASSVFASGDNEKYPAGALSEIGVLIQKADSQLNKMETQIHECLDNLSERVAQLESKVGEIDSKISTMTTEGKYKREDVTLPAPLLIKKPETFFVKGIKETKAHHGDTQIYEKRGKSGKVASDGYAILLETPPFEESWINIYDEVIEEVNAQSPVGTFKPFKVLSYKPLYPHYGDGAQTKLVSNDFFENSIIAPKDEMVLVQLFKSVLFKTESMQWSLLFEEGKTYQVGKRFADHIVRWRFGKKAL